MINTSYFAGMHCCCCSYLIDSGWSLVQSLFAIAAGPASALVLLVPFGVRIFGAPAAAVLPRLPERSPVATAAAPGTHVNSTAPSSTAGTASAPAGPTAADQC
jgi:hypothetical protein